MSILSGLIRLQREQQLATQSALRLGSLNFAVTMRNTSRCRAIESSLSEVRSRAAAQAAELERLQTQLLDVRDGAEQQHADLERLQADLADSRAEIERLQARRHSADGALNVGVALLCAWTLGSPLVAVPMGVASALIRLLTGRRTRSAYALVHALRLATLAALIVRARRALQRVGLLHKGADGSHLEEVCRGLRALLGRLAAAVREGARALRSQSLVLAASPACEQLAAAARGGWQAVSARPGVQLAVSAARDGWRAAKERSALQSWALLVSAAREGWQAAKACVQAPRPGALIETAEPGDDGAAEADAPVASLAGAFAPSPLAELQANAREEKGSALLAKARAGAKAPGGTPKDDSRPAAGVDGAAATAPPLKLKVVSDDAADGDDKENSLTS